MATIALDAMGGDAGPTEAVAAAAAVSLEREIVITVVGDQQIIDEHLRGLSYDPEFLSVYHASEAIGMGESPREALDAKPDASLLVGARLVRDGYADALVSAGNTGAAILACARTFNKLPGVPRTALAAVYPTERRRGAKGDPFSLILDVGATVQASADALVAFACMGSAYAQRISNNPHPRVALLSNGGEPYKGTPAIIEAHKRLAANPQLNFIGNIEGVDLPRGRADVVVTDGFTGNVVLKMLEGIHETVVDMARFAYRSKLSWRIGLFMLRGGINQLKQVTDWQQYGGAPILGFDRLFIKAHGRSSARAIANAIKVANKAVRTGLCKELAERLSQTATPTPLPSKPPSAQTSPE